MKDRIKTYLMKLTRIRKYLMDANKGNRNMSLALNLEYVMNHIKNVDFTETGIRKFFQNNGDRIISLIPGKDSKCHEKLMKEFNELRQLTII